MPRRREGRCNGPRLRRVALGLHQQHPILLESIQFAESVVSMSIEPESSADKQKLEDTLTLLTRDAKHCEQLIAQMGEWGYPVERLD